MPDAGTEQKPIDGKWFNLTELNETATIDIIGDIGSYENSSEAFQREVLDSEASKIVLNISSLGGNINDALQIYDFLRSYKGDVKARITGMTASSATILAMGADTIEMSENALMLIHNAWMPLASGNADELEKQAQELRKIDDILVNIYKKKTKKNKSEISALMTEERWLNYKEAREFKLVDSKTTGTKNQWDTLILNAIEKQGLPKLPDTVINKLKTNKMDLNNIAEKIDTLTAKVEGWFKPENTDEKAEVMAKLDTEIGELKNLYDWQITEKTDTITSLNEQIENLKKEHESQIAEVKNESEKQIADLNSEVERLSGNETVVTSANETELEKETPTPSPFDAFAESLRNQVI